MPNAHDLDPASLLPPFESSLPAALRFAGESALLKFRGLTREIYSTERFLSDSSDRSSGVSKTISVDGGRILLSGGGSPELMRYTANHGLKLAGDADTSRAARFIETALKDVIAPYPFLRSALSELVWCCHIVLPHGDDYDLSFSDPAIPFSIFVSTPVSADQSSILRVAESLIHETLHLQLTLFEGLVPLVDTASTWSMYSPWKQQERPAQGVLHGLYVFCVLRWMWRQISRTAANGRDFALRRIAEIDQEVASVRAIEGSPALTEAGRRFLGGLFVR
jgi:HEXXH motif-containing protein